ncbi:MAG: enolase C-terminal domain-like protein [bacterium]
MKSDIKVLEVKPFFSYEVCRVPLKFGNVVMDELTYCHVRAKVENQDGKIAYGWGSIFLSDTWAFPTKDISHEIKDKAMKDAVIEISKLTENYKNYSHPIDIFLEIKKHFVQINKAITSKYSLIEEFPFLASLVCASPIDAALHDAFGNVNKISSYDGYGPEFMEKDLSYYLGNNYKGEYISNYLKKDYCEKVPVFHLVGGLDKLRETEINDKDPKDGIPVTLDQWIKRDGLICLKIKLQGNNLKWDLDRTCEVVSIAHEIQSQYGKNELYFSADTNEQCEHPDYIVEYLMKLKDLSPIAFKELLYVEQPTERDLRAHKYDMRKIGNLKPVIIDESLIGMEDFDLAIELGWSGIALKTCKGHSTALLYAVKSEKLKIPYTIQDLTNPGLSLIHSVGLGARLNPMKGVESNSSQFFPKTSDPETKIHPNIFIRKDGCVQTNSIQGYGLGFQVDKIERNCFQCQEK